MAILTQKNKVSTEISTEISSDKKLILNNILQFVNYKIAEHTEILSEEISTEVMARGKHNSHLQKTKKSFLAAGWCWLRRIFIFIFLIILITIGFLCWLISSESGLRFMLNQGHNFFSDVFQYQTVSGSVLNGFTLNSFEFNVNNSQKIRAQTLSLKWSEGWVKKFWHDQHIGMDELRVSGLTVSVKSNSEKKISTFGFKEIKALPELSFNKIHIPITFELKALNFDQFELKQNENTLIKDGSMLLATQLNSDGVNIDLTQLNFQIIQPQLSIPLELKGQFNIDFMSNFIRFSLKGMDENIIYANKSLHSDFTLELEGKLNDLTLRVMGQVAGEFVDKKDKNFVLKPIRLESTTKIKQQDQVSALLEVKSESAVMTANAAWSKNAPDLLEANLVISVPSFKEVLTNMGAGGKMTGAIKIKGKLPIPSVSAKVSIDNIMLETFRIKALRLDATWDALKAKANQLTDFGLDLNLMIADVYQARTLIWKGEVNLKGTLGEHALILAAQSPFGNTTLNIQGKADLNTQAPSWTGNITQFDLKPIKIGLLSLAQPASVFVSSKQQILSNVCLNKLPASLCIQGQHLDGNTFGTFAIRSLGADMLKEFLPKELTLNTYLNAVLSGQFKSTSDFIGVADLQLVPGTVTYLHQGRPFVVPLKRTLFNVEVMPKGAVGKLDLDWGDYLNGKGTATINELLGAQTLSGQLKINVPSIEWLKKMMPQTKTLVGKIHAEGTIGGTLSTPIAAIKLAFDQGRIFIAELNQEFNDVFLNAELLQGKPVVNVKGGVSTDTGKLAISGVIDILKNTFDIKLKGNQIHIANSDVMKIWMNPDVSLKGSAKEMNLTGSLFIPEAYIRAGRDAQKSRPIVAKSTDVIVINRGSKKGYDFLDLLKMNFQIDLGDKVDVGNSVFSARLTGGIKLTKALNQSIKGNGTLQIATGNYEIYGQKLSIDRGRIMFSGGVLNNPGLDLQASRQFNNTQSVGKVTVGVRVSGSLQKPKLRLFSMPTMPDTAIVSYLILGRGPSGKSGGESLMLLNAVRKIAMNKTNNSDTPTLANQLGLDEFGLSQDGSGNASLGLGKNINDRLYFGLGVSLMSQDAYLTIRYKLLEWLHFEGQMGANESSADVLYSKERD